MRKIVMNSAKETAIAQTTWIIKREGPMFTDAAHAAAGDIDDINRIFVFSMAEPSIASS